MYRYLNGHTAAVFINFEKKPTKEQLIEKLVKFQRLPAGSRASECTEAVHPAIWTEDNRPQVKLDVDYENGMGIIDRTTQRRLYL